MLGASPERASRRAEEARGKCRSALIALDRRKAEEAPEVVDKASTGRKGAMAAAAAAGLYTQTAQLPLNATVTSRGAASRRRYRSRILREGV